jgi:hypothetical protein
MQWKALGNRAMNMRCKKPMALSIKNIIFYPKKIEGEFL